MTVNRSDFQKQLMSGVTATDKIIVLDDDGTDEPGVVTASTFAASAQFSNRYISRSILTTTGDLVTNAGGDIVRVTRDVLAQDTAFTSRYGLTGTGSPEGVVTASVGARYIDTALTNGASEWVKVSGSSNTGWRVSSGDTSWREISTDWKAALTAASATRFVNTGASYNIYIRRVGPQVFLNIYDNFQTDGTAFLQNVPGLIPSGFRPDVFPEQYCQAAPIFARNSASVVGKFEVHTNAGGGTFVMTATNPNNGFHAYWVTSQAWPSTLPGSAI